MTIQPGDSGAGHHQARNTQELLDAADQVGERQEQRYSRDPSTDEFPVVDGTQAQTQETREPAAAQRTATHDSATQDSARREPATQGAGTQDPAMQDARARQSEMAVPQPMQEAVAEPAVEQAPAEHGATEHAAAGQHTERQSERHGQRTDDEEHVALFDPREAEELQGRWREVQTAFVDDPRSAVQGADQLVAQVIQSLTASFAAHKKELDSQWQDSDQSGPATEDLRLALRRYRTLFNQLLNT